MEECINIKYFIVTEENGEQVRHLYTEDDVIEKETTIVSKEYQHIEI